MTYEVEPYYEEEIPKEMARRFDTVVSMGTPLWFYAKEESMSRPSFTYLNSIQTTKKGFETKPFFTCKKVASGRWYFKFEYNGPTHIYPKDGDYSSPFNRTGTISNEMPPQFKGLARSVIKQLFENWSGESGFTVWEQA